MDIDVRSNIAELSRWVTRVEREQLPFATALALTETAKDVQRDITADLPQRIDRPTPFTRKAFAIKSARKTDLTASVFAKDIQAKYLARLETGGERLPQKRALVIPAQTRLNQYGNMPKGALQRMLARGDVFSGQVRGIGGIWQRLTDGRLRLLVAYEPSAEYEPQLGFREGARDVVLRRIGPNFRSALARALRTAR